MKKKALLGLSLALAVPLLLNGCGSNSAEPESGAATGPEDKKPVSFSIMTNFYNQTPPADDTEFKKKLEQLTNSSLKIQWVSANNYTDKLNVTLASGDLPDMLYINDPFTTVFRNMAAQQAFWDITPYLKDYPNLTKYIDKVAWDATKMADGKNYGIPRPRSVDGDSFFILRKDWLDNLGLAEPKTADELYAVMKAFVEKDPDKNGKNDTVGFSGYFNADSMGGMNLFEYFFHGATGDWKLQKDGTLAFTALLPEEKQALEYMAKMYKEKLLPEDLAALKNSQARDLFTSGKSGIIGDKAGNLPSYLPTLNKIQPGASALPLTSINGYNTMGSGFAGIYAISKKVPEDKLKRILEAVNASMTSEVFLHIKYGLEGVHYKVENGKKVIDAEAKTRDALSDYLQIFNAGPDDENFYKSSLPADKYGNLADTLIKIEENRRSTSVPNYSIGLYSETKQKINAELMKKTQDLKTKIIIGVEPISSWDAYVAKLKTDADLIKMTEEINAAYQKRVSAK